MFLKKIDIYTDNQIPTSHSENVGSTFSGNIPLISEQEDFVEQKELCDIVAEKKGYIKTGLSNVYKDEKSGFYYVWNNEKQKFIKDKNIKLVYENGYSERINPGYHNEIVCIYNPKGKSIGRASDFNAKAQVVGLSKPPKHWTGQNYFKELFYNSEEKRYYLWDANKQRFVKSTIEIAGEDLIKAGNTYYRASSSGIQKVTAEEFYAKKFYMVKNPEEEGTYWCNDSQDMNLYVFDDKTNIFYSPVQKKREEMISQKADGIVGNFTQDNTKDCWLLASIETLRPELMEKFVDENGNEFDFIKSEYLEIDPETGDMTVKLKGPGIQYVITDDEINDELSKLNPKYSYGEKEIVAIEMAVEKFYRECIDNSVGRSIFTTNRPIAVTDELRGGFASDAIAILTGLNPKGISGDDIKAGTIEDLYDKGLYFVANMNSEFTGSTSNHGVVVVGYDDKNIYYDDSNNESGEPLSMKKDDFYRMCFSIDYATPGEMIPENQRKYVRRKFGI